MDINGTTFWTTKFGHPDNYDYSISGAFTQNNDLFVVGKASNFITGTDIHLTRLDEKSGSIIWSKLVLRSGSAIISLHPEGIVTDSLGNVFVLYHGSVSGYGNECFISKFDKDGTLVKTIKFGFGEYATNDEFSSYHSDSRTLFTNASSTNNDSIIVHGNTKAFGGRNNFFIAKFESSLEPIWVFVFGIPSENDYLSDCHFLESGSILCIGDRGYCLSLILFNVTEDFVSNRYHLNVKLAIDVCQTDGNRRVSGIDVIHQVESDSFVIVGSMTRISQTGSFSLLIRKSSDDSYVISSAFFGPKLGEFHTIFQSNHSVLSPKFSGSEERRGPLIFLGSSAGYVCPGKLSGCGIVIPEPSTLKSCHDIEITSDFEIVDVDSDIWVKNINLSFSTTDFRIDEMEINSTDSGYVEYSDFVHINRSCWTCFGVDYDYTGVVCSDHGVCESWDKCMCEFLYPGSNCEKWSCFGIPSTDVDKVCGNNVTHGPNGICSAENECICYGGYSSLQKQKHGECTEWECGNIDRRDEVNVCSGRGSCVSPQVCRCKNGYEGINCEAWMCGSHYMTEMEAVCSGNGKCIEPDICNCDFGVDGENCERKTLLNIAIYTSLSFASLMLLISCFFVVFVCFCFLILLYLICSLFVVFMFRTIIHQRSGIRRYQKLKNFDLLLKEQLLDSDDAPKLKINKNLFQIPQKEIETLEVIGRGGSQSVVFRAKWRDQVVAYKVFKTSWLCQTQEMFKEFELEVGILGSVSHPNIIRFFGASLEIPRVGIVMEYCENGEILEFMKDFSRKMKPKTTEEETEDEKKFRYPIKEKVRMLKEIVSAMCYLHSRSIVHRDLKCQNVLVSKEEQAKLMDFGLSKFLDENMTTNTSRIGTGTYMPPEIIAGVNYSTKCDVFSFAILLFIVITENEKPYGEIDHNVQYRVASDPKYRPNIQSLRVIVNEEKGEEFSRNICDLVEKMWDQNPDVRPSFKEIRNIFVHTDDVII